MAELRAGDHVLDSPTSSSRVAVTQHRAPPLLTSPLVVLHHASGSLSLTPDHVLLTDAGYVAARHVAPGVALSGGERVSRIEAAAGAVVNPVTVSGTILAAGPTGSPVVAATHPEWIAPWMLSSALPLPCSLANALSYAFPSATQAFYDAHAEPLLAALLPSVQPLAALPPPLVAAIFAAADGCYATAFVAAHGGAALLLAAAVAVGSWVYVGARLVRAKQ
mmetsp:Transcript_52456/g.139407  ORF Transcript_52456/g.139407 Transcript_52456/m.139407 type:complete len:221 (+) Transcript_52456:400-1062(+)